MDHTIVKLINILDDKFEVPYLTNGMNVVRNKAQILAVVNDFWPMQDNYSMEQFESALQEYNPPSIVNWLGAREYLLTEK